MVLLENNRVWQRGYASSYHSELLAYLKMFMQMDIFNLKVFNPCTLILYILTGSWMFTHVYTHDVWCRLG